MCQKARASLRLCCIRKTGDDPASGLPGRRCDGAGRGQTQETAERNPDGFALMSKTGGEGADCPLPLPRGYFRLGELQERRVIALRRIKP